MRITVVHGLPVGGALRVAVETARVLASRHEVRVMEVAVEGSAEIAWSPGIEVRRFPVRGATSRLPGNVAALAVQRRWSAAQRDVAAALDADPPDAVLVHPCQMTQAPELLLLTEVPTAYYMHEVRRRTYEAGYLDPPNGHALRRGAIRLVRRLEDARPKRIDRAATRAATMRLGNSAFTVESVSRTYGVGAARSLPGVDLDVFRLDPDRRRGSHVLIVGGLERNKAAALAVKAIGLVPAERRPSLVVTGQRSWGPYVDDLLLEAERCGVDIDVRSGVTDAELVELYQMAAATCCLARLEPFGLSSIESLACGTPVLAVREGGFREVVIDGLNGALVDRSPADVAAGLTRVLDCTWDPVALRASVEPELGLDAATRRIEAQMELITGGCRG